MPQPDFISIFISRLNRAGFLYMVTGSVACTIYGEPRLTHDVDLILQLNSKNVEKIPKTFPLEQFYCPPLEALTIEAKRPLRGHFNLIHHATGFKADVYLVGQDPLHLWAMANRKSFGIKAEQVWLAPPEYVILRKLEFYREGGSDKHLRDIAGILALSSEYLDFDILRQRIGQVGLDKEWEKAKQVFERY